MTKNISISLTPADAADESIIKTQIAAECGVKPERISGYAIQKRSIDARSRQARIIIQAQVFIDEKTEEAPTFDPQLQMFQALRT